jgi:hypothetical protein
MIVVYKAWALTSEMKDSAADSVGFVGHVSIGIGMWVALVGDGIALASDFVGRE